jgi:Uma2 family endonuclease
MVLPAQSVSSERVKLTYEEFLEQLDEDTLAEWVDGEVVYLSPASLEHQDIAGFLNALLRAYVQKHQLGRVIAAPFQMRLLRSERGREPDLLFVANENLHRLHDTYLEGGADLVVEITSAESLLRDRGEKFAEYELEGIREYWVIDPEGKRVDFFVLGRTVVTSVVGGRGRSVSQCGAVGFSVASALAVGASAADGGDSPV